jgi:hypothetical protein
MSVLKRFSEYKAQVPPDAMVELNQMLWGVVQAWEEKRRVLTLAGVRPIGLHMKVAA